MKNQLRFFIDNYKMLWSTMKAMANVAYYTTSYVWSIFYNKEKMLENELLEIKEREEENNKLLKEIKESLDVRHKIENNDSSK